MARLSARDGEPGGGPVGEPAGESVRESVGERVRRQAWAWYAVVGAVLVVLAIGLPGETVRNVVYAVVGLGPVVAIAVGLRLHRPRPRLPWVLMLLGQAMWVLGDTYYSYVDQLRPEASYVPGDLAYLCAYPLFAAAFLILVTRRLGPQRDQAGMLDTATVTAGIALLAWVVLARPAVADSIGSGLIATLTAVGYPLGDILLAGGVVRLLFLSGTRKPALRFLCLASVALVGADFVHALHPAEDGSLAALVAPVLWLSSYVLWGTAALHPSMAGAAQPAPGAGTSFTRARLVCSALATFSAPIVLIVQALSGQHIDVWPVAVGSVTMFSLVVARMYLTIQQLVEANDQRERLEQELVRRAVHDALTGLTNRAGFMETLETSLGRARRSGHAVGLLFVDLDGFKAINDSFGHRAGDTVLREVADRLLQQVRGGDTVARFGGDEFVVLLDGVDSELAAVVVANRLVEAVSRPVDLGRLGTGRVGASIGVTVSRDRDTSAEALVHEADTAAYRAKADGKGRSQVYDASLRTQLGLRAELEDALLQAVDRDELLLHYQPIVDLRSGTVIAYEALVRWNRPGHGMQPPGEFIPVAEETELICAVDAWALTRATRDFAALPPGPDGLLPRVGVNIAGRHLSRPRIVDDVAVALARSRLAPDRLTVELTETTLIDDALAIRHLEVLRAGGVRVSIDDFGTGYNAIESLGRLPMDSVKIDRRFVDPDSTTAPILLQLMVEAAHVHGLPVVVEGVEHEHQLVTLRGLGCEAAQGFLLGRPGPLEEVVGRPVPISLLDWSA